MIFNSLGIPQISLRHLKAMLFVARLRNLTKAAGQLNRSQTAITKAICELESRLGFELFDRSSTGMKPTVYGEILANRLEGVLGEFAAAGQAYSNYNKDVEYDSIPIFSMELSYKRLAAVIALHDRKDADAAATALGVTQAAVYSSLRQVESLLGMAIFERSPYGFLSTAYCRILVRHIKLAFSQLRHAIDELNSLNGVMVGRLIVGTLPYTRTILMPRAINRLLDAYPGLKVSTEEGPYALLESQLRSGEIDLIVGAIRPDDIGSDLLTEQLFEDHLSVIVRSGHPLEGKERVTITELQKYPWVLPARLSPSRKIFDQLMENKGLDPPEHVIETSSLSNVRGLLVDSDRLALLSEHQIYYEKKFGLLTALPIELEGSNRPIGITMRAHTPPSPAVALFLTQLRKVSNEFLLILQSDS